MPTGSDVRSADGERYRVRRRHAEPHSAGSAACVINMAVSDLAVGGSRGTVRAALPALRRLVLSGEGEREEAETTAISASVPTLS